VDTKELSSIMEKIAKLKGLAEQPGTADEAIAATEAIRRLMLRYNLTEEQVHRAHRQEGRTVYGKHFIDLKVKWGSGHHWRFAIIHAMADYNFCKTVTARTDMYSYPRIWIVGQEHNAVFIEKMYDYLSEEFLRLCRLGYDNLSPYGRMHILRWNDSFLKGCAAGLRSKLAEQRRTELDSAGSALMVMVDADLEKAVTTYFPKLRKGESGKVNPHAFEQGVAAGRSVNLAKQIEGAS
jgi:hypothetical protein